MDSYVGRKEKQHSVKTILVCGCRKYPPGHHGREGFVRLCVLSFNVNFQSGLELHCEVVLPDDDSFKPALYQGLVEGLQVCGMLFDEILQFIDVGNSPQMTICAKQWLQL